MKPLIVGESNPFGGDEYFALYPEPDGCSGDRLCRMVMGLRRETYMEAFERANLVRGKWSMRAARLNVLSLIGSTGAARAFDFVLLGRKVAEAFGIPKHLQPPHIEHRDVLRFVCLPHPSGLNRMWSNPGLVPACREVLRAVLPSIPFGEVQK